MADHGPDKATRWLPRDDVILADALVQQKQMGKNRDGAVFSMESWNQIAEQLKGSELDSGGGPKNVIQCKARWQRLKIEYRTVKHVRSQPGFSWDDKNCMLIANAQAWDDYIAKHRDAQTWRKKSFPAYDRVAFLIENEKGSEKGDATFLRRWESSAQHEEEASGHQQPGTTVFSVSAPIPDSGVQMMPFAVSGPGTFSVPMSNAPTMTVSQGIGKRKRGGSTRQLKRTKGATSPTLNEDSNIAPPHHFESSTFGGAPSSLTSPPTFTVPPGHPTGMPSVGPAMVFPPSHSQATATNRMSFAIQQVEDNEGLSDEDFVKAVQLFRRRQEVTEAYLAIQSKRARSLYLKAEMADSLFEGDDH